jgi:hypothetical protein
MELVPCFFSLCSLLFLFHSSCLCVVTSSSCQPCRRPIVVSSWDDAPRLLGHLGISSKMVLEGESVEVACSFVRGRPGPCAVPLAAAASPGTAVTLQHRPGAYELIGIMRTLVAHGAAAGDEVWVCLGPPGQRSIVVGWCRSDSGRAAAAAATAATATTEAAAAEPGRRQ